MRRPADLLPMWRRGSPWSPRWTRCGTRRPGPPTPGWSSSIVRPGAPA
jgi:hypothetical protein